MNGNISYRADIKRDRGDVLDKVFSDAPVGICYCFILVQQGYPHAHFVLPRIADMLAELVKLAVVIGWVIVNLIQLEIAVVAILIIECMQNAV